MPEPTKSVAPADPAKADPLDDQTILQASQTLQVSSGPLPDPDVLAKYERVYPGLAKCIVDGFEAEYRHRHEMENVAVQGDIAAMELSHASQRRGQIFGLVISLIGLLLGSGLIYLNHDWAGSVIGAGGLASVLAAFFKGSSNRARSDDSRIA